MIKNAKWIVAIIILMLLQLSMANAQPKKIEYLGMTIPETKPLLFAPGIISTSEGVHSMISFNPDHTEVMWGPNYHVDDKDVLRTKLYEQWSGPIAAIPSV